LYQEFIGANRLTEDIGIDYLINTVVECFVYGWINIIIVKLLYHIKIINASMSNVKIFLIILIESLKVLKPIKFNFLIKISL